ncbi:hypothetical protein ACNKHU_24185 [Shigella flexneri]
MAVVAFLQTAHHFVDHRDHHAGDRASSLKSRFGWLTSASRSSTAASSSFFGLPLLSSL